MATKARKVPGMRFVGSGVKTAYNPDSLSSAGDVATTTLNIPGAKVGDIVTVTPNTRTDGAVWQGSVTAASTVTISVTAAKASVDQVSTDVSVLVQRP